MAEATGTDTLLARLEALTTRLDEQAARIASLEAENAGLRASRSVSAPDPIGADGAEPKVGRRGLLTKALGATAAAALLTVMKEPKTAEATSRTTLLGGSASTGNYGIAAAVDVFDPGTLIPNVTGLGFGVIGTFGSPGYAPPFSAGVLGQGSGAFYGVIGLSQNNPGVHGQSTSSVGVIGKSTSSFAVYGRSTSGTGAVGESDSGDGVYGVTVSGTGARGDSTNGVGVLGISANAIGVRGVGPQFGVWGHSPNGTGVYATSATNSALVAESSSGLAGEFRGNVFVTGTLTARSKSAVVTLPDGTERRLYCMEAPEAIFEDFGRDRLVDGAARVALDPGFAATVRSDDYDVFLTPYGDSRGLFVTTRTPRGFEVREQGGGASALDFGYRVVAARRDPQGGRLDHVHVPTNRINVDTRVPDRPRPPDHESGPGRQGAPDGDSRAPGPPARPRTDGPGPR